MGDAGGAAPPPPPPRSGVLCTPKVLLGSGVPLIEKCDGRGGRGGVPMGTGCAGAAAAPPPAGASAGAPCCPSSVFAAFMSRSSISLPSKPPTEAWYAPYAARRRSSAASASTLAFPLAMVAAGTSEEMGRSPSTSAAAAFACACSGAISAGFAMCLPPASHRLASVASASPPAARSKPAGLSASSEAAASTSACTQSVTK
mmetsp:Transcript_2961/g.11943  ORF Transcript_2961/g.11943 Transcript_2961/m.11943 type:complete len:201 (+) Transcript_2961:2234-2836(+)